jgi:hypothetical protein
VPKKVAAGYLASLSPLKKAQLVLAFSRALNEAEFFSVTALLRSFGSIGDPFAAEAREELFRIVGDAWQAWAEAERHSRRRAVRN